MKLFNPVTTIFVALGLLASAGLARADGHPETPTAAPAGVKLVDAKQVQDLQAKGATLVDARQASEFGEGTIKGAISVPYDPEKSVKAPNFDSSQDKFDFASKLKDKNAQLVVFCNAGTCFKSYKASVVLAKNGYKNVHWYRAGFPDWKAKKLPIE